MPTSSATFAKYRNGVLLETGSYLGDGIQAALDAGFKRVISIELSNKYYGICARRFQNDSRVRIVKGDSAIVLESVIANIDEPITFWLDGHYSCGDTALGKWRIPLLQELDAIAKHRVKTHTILIDDMRCWKAFIPEHGFAEADIIAAIEKIGAYTLVWEDSPQAPKDILAAVAVAAPKDS